ncbi:pectin acetylesterase-family hydrolase [Variovorax sp. 770b2]|uniref:pectin acetylesterase-family hydrolase n=1 Tax=Variovorax sp. 770b2 TaxID=1566271 RepID=UPI0008E9158F|nr:pectin acetylesterase-family hydrolase [Variovorax sp. 770b2]SFP61022.1 Pectinacetylesterase [Variovorax sp. 770b2]
MNPTRVFWSVAAALALSLSMGAASSAPPPAQEGATQSSRADAQAFIDEATRKYNAGLVNSAKPGQAIVPAAGPNWSADLDTWVEYTFPASSGASCMNGTPYRMYYKVSSDAGMRDKVLVDFEGGGACWNFDSCRPGADLGAANPDGLPSGYIQGNGIVSNTAPQLISPVLEGNTFLVEAAARLLFGRGSGKLDDGWWGRLWQTTTAPETQKWTKVVFPYCTGDVSAGASFRSFNDPAAPDDATKTKYVNFNGLNNVRAAMRFLQDNKFTQSLSDKGYLQQLLVYGGSAGGYSAQFNYPMIRQALAGEKTRVALLNDSGPLLTAPVYNAGETISPADLEKTPAAKFWQLAAHTWGFFQQPLAADIRVPGHPEYAEQASGVIARWEKTTGKKLNITKATGGDTGSFSTLLSRRYPDDRFGLASFQQDQVISRFFFVGAQNAEVAGLEGSALRDAKLELFHKELDLVRANLGPLPNFGYYMPWSRYLVIGSHVTTALTFAGTETSRAANMRDDGGRIQPAFDGDVGHFLNNLLSANSLEAEPVLKEVGPEKAEPLNLAGVAGWLLSLFNVFG